MIMIVTIEAMAIVCAYVREGRGGTVYQHGNSLQ